MEEPDGFSHQNNASITTSHLNWSQASGDPKEKDLKRHMLKESERSSKKIQIQKSGEMERIAKENKDLKLRLAMLEDMVKCLTSSPQENNTKKNDERKAKSTKSSHQKPVDILKTKQPVMTSCMDETDAILSAEGSNDSTNYYSVLASTMDCGEDTNMDPVPKHNAMSSGRTIMDLDDYTLRHVFSFLPKLPEKATVGYTCLRFRSIIGPLIGKEVIFHDHYPKQFYAQYGIYIKKIDITHTRDKNEICYLIPKYCHNIESVSFMFYHGTDSEFVKNMLASNKSIKHIDLFSPYITDIACEHISRLQGLETLILRHLYNFPGVEHLYRLTKLKELFFKDCQELNADNFIIICKGNKLLKLNITGCRKLNTEAFRTLVETQTELEEIHVEGWYESGEMSQIGLLENLRRMFITYEYDSYSENSKSLLKELPEYCPPLLKYLNIYCFLSGPPRKDLERIQKFENLEELVIFEATNLNDSVLTKISKACKRLQRVEVKRCDEITNEGILQLIRNLKLLTELNVEGCENLRGKLYQDMCEAKRTSDEKIKLKVHNAFLDNVTDEQHHMNQDLVQLFLASKLFESKAFKGAKYYRNEFPPLWD